MSRPKKITIAVIVVLLGLMGYALYIVTIAGEFKTIEPHFNGECRLVPDIVGPEDIVITADGRSAFISSQDRRAHLAGRPAEGTIYYYDLTDPDAMPVDLLPDAPENYHPHGIALYESEAGTRLFVVNHPGGDVKGDLPGPGPKHAIEIYEVEGDPPTLTHVRTVTGELLITPNDVAPVGPEQFYATNDHGTGDKTGRMLEDYLRLSRSHLVFFDGTAFKRLPGEYGYANGIIASRDGETVFVSAPTDRTLYVFDRDPQTNALRPQTEVFLGTAMDNVNVDVEGNLWLGGHPKMLTFVKHAADPQVPAPSQVLRISRKGSDKYTIKEVFLSDGTDVPASSSAARHGNRLLIGSVYGEGFLDCRMNTSPN